MQNSCVSSLHTQYRSVLGQVNWLQSRTQYKACYRFSRCAYAVASPTIVVVKTAEQTCQIDKIWIMCAKLLASERKAQTDWLSWCRIQEQCWQQFSARPSYFLSWRHVSIQGRLWLYARLWITQNKSCGSIHHCFWAVLILRNVLELVSFCVVCGWTSVPRAWLFTCGPMQTIW